MIVTVTVTRSRWICDAKSLLQKPQEEADRLPPPRTLILDFTMTHPRYGRSLLNLNGQLTNTRRLDVAPEPDGVVQVVARKSLFIISKYMGHEHKYIRHETANWGGRGLGYMLFNAHLCNQPYSYKVVVGPGAQLCTMLEVWSPRVLRVGMSTLGRKRLCTPRIGDPQVPMTLEHPQCGFAAPGLILSQRFQIGAFRPIRVDHTNCLQVAIKTHSFIILDL
jgi:hypothetical protein